jgi:hypothetical protein
VEAVEAPNEGCVGWVNGPGDGAVLFAKGDGALDGNEVVANPVNPKPLACVNGEALGGSVASIPESIIVDDDEDVNGVGTLLLPKGCEGAARGPPNGEAPDINGDGDRALVPVVELPPKGDAPELEVPNGWDTVDVVLELPNGWVPADGWNGLGTVRGPKGFAVDGCCVPMAEANDVFVWPALSLAP